MPDAQRDASHNDLAARLRRNWIPAVLVIILMVGAYFRFIGVNWDQDQHQQPDERFMTMVAGQISPVTGIAQYFDTERSPLNPLGHGFYTYGMLPLFLTRYVAEWIQQTEYNQVVLVGRVLSGLFDLAAVVGIYLLGARLYRRRVGLLAAGLYAAAVLPIQLSHFFAVDSFTTVFVIAAFYVAVLIMEGHQHWTYVLFGIFTGLAMTTKVSIAPLVGVVVLAGLAYVLEARSDAEERKSRLLIVLGGWIIAGLCTAVVFRIFQPYAFTGPGFFDLRLNPRWLEIIRTVSDQVAGRADFPPNHHWAGRPFSYGWTNMVRWGMGLPLGLTATLAWFWAAWRLWKGEWRRHLLLVVWVGMFFIWQSANFWRYTRYYLPIYPFAILLAAWALFELFDRARKWQITKQYPDLAGRLAMVLLLGVLVTTFAYAFAFTRIYTRPHTRVSASQWMLQNLPGRINLVVDTPSGTQQVPLDMPADLVLELNEPWTASFTPPVSGQVSQIIVPDVRLNEPETAAAKLVFSLDRGEPNPELLTTVQGELRFDESSAEGKKDLVLGLPPVEVEAGKSYNLTVNLLEGPPLSFPGVAIAKETGWDDTLPLIIDGIVPYPGIFRDLDLKLHEPDTEDKREQMLEVLDQADYIVIASNRAYDAMPRLPLRFPMTTAFYQALFGCDSPDIASCAYPARTPLTGELGFDLIATFESHPNLGPFTFPDQEAQESFTVYDHPKVMVFQKSDDFSLMHAEQLLGSVDLTQVVDQNAKQVSKAPTGLRLPASRLDDQKAAGTWSKIFSYYSFQNEYQFLAVLSWYILLLLIGWIAFPITFNAFRGLSDRGYTFTRIIGMLVIAWLAWFAGSLRVVPFTQGTLWLCLILVIALASGIAWWQRANLLEFVKSRWRYLLLIEVLFLALFLFVLVLRWNNPDLWHPYTGGEKPGDFALFNAVIKTQYFPPYDPWLAGHYVNYYYYGYVLSAIPTKLLGIVPGIAYNLLIPLWFGLTGTGAFGIAYNLVASRLTPSDSASSKSADSKYPYLAGGIAVVFMVLLGNLFELRMLWERLPGFAPAPVANQTFLQQAGGVVSGFQQVLTGKANLLAGYKGSWYFDASRAILNGQPAAPITEFPYFTFLYADLHPHMMGMAIILAGLGWILSFVRSPQLITKALTRQQVLPIGATWLVGGLILGATFPTNTWDFPVLVVLGVVAIGYAIWAKMRSDRRTKIGHMILHIGLFLLLVLGLYAPFRQWFATGDQALILWTGPRTPLTDYLTVHGLFLFLIISFLAFETVRLLRPKFQSFIHTPLGQLVPTIKWGTVILFGGVLILLVGFLWSWQNDFQAVIVATLLVIWTGVLLLSPGETLERRVVLALIGAGIGLTLIAELFALKGDVGRMNVVFKTYLMVWIFFSVAAAAALVWLLPKLSSSRLRWIWWGILALLVFAASTFTVVGTLAKVQDRWPDIDNPPRTFDGLTYMLGSSGQDPGMLDSAIYNDEGNLLELARDYEAIRWMHENISGTPTIVEGHSTEYRWGSRFSVYTGLPTVVGWSWHLRQHNAVLPSSVVENRIEDVHDFYNTSSRSEAFDFLERYQIDYIVVGELERAHYAEDGLEKFAQMATDGVLKAVYPPDATGSEVRIYAVQLDR